MRRAAAIGLALAALAAGCGGGSEGSGPGSVSQSGRQGQATTATAQVTDGRLGAAVVARPGQLKVTGGSRKITTRLTLPRSTRHALGAEENCADGDVAPTADNVAHVSDVIFCLMNAMRENAGLPDLVQQDELAQASVEHSQDMVDNHYFAHDSLDGRDVVARLKAVSYIPTEGDWVVGENLAWGSGALATPKALVNAWMNSPPHRENLLSADYREVGMGVVYGTPDQDAPDGVTVTTDFGTRPTPSVATTTATQAVAGTRRTGRTHARASARCKHRHGSAKRRCLRAARKGG